MFEFSLIKFLHKLKFILSIKLFINIFVTDLCLIAFVLIQTNVLYETLQISRYDLTTMITACT